MNVLAHTVVGTGPADVEHKLLIETKRGLLREDGKVLAGSFNHRCGELMREGWQPRLVRRRFVTFSRGRPRLVKIEGSLSYRLR